MTKFEQDLFKTLLGMYIEEVENDGVVVEGTQVIIPENLNAMITGLRMAQLILNYERW